MEIWSQNYSAPSVSNSGDEVHGRNHALSIEDGDGNVSETVLVERDEAVQIMDHSKHRFLLTIKHLTD